MSTPNLASRSALALVRKLIAIPGIDVNLPDVNCSPLIFAACKGDSSLVANLLQHPELNVNRADDRGTALMHAIRGQSVAIASALISCDRVDLNYANEEGETALLLALITSRRAIINALLHSPRLDLWAKSADGSTQLLTAVRSGFVGLVRRMMDFIRASPIPPPISDVNAAFREIFDPQESEGRGFSLSYSSVAGGRDYLGLIRPFLEIPGVDFPQSLLIRAAKANDGKLVQFLLNLPQIDVNFVSPNGKTAFSVAVSHSRDQIVDLIRQCPRFDPLARAASGASQIALAAHSVPVVSALLDCAEFPICEVNLAIR
jgi:ankyrin repeat protein